jgi:hypothetical protein
MLQKSGKDLLITLGSLITIGFNKAKGVNAIAIL